MTETILMHDAATKSFDNVDGVTTDDDGNVTFSWDEIPIVKVDAPSDLEGAFDTERFYKIEGATVARPIKQPYHVGDSVEVYKKPAEELRKAAWSFDNKPFTLGHPETGMVKDVNDIHGFWRNIRYSDDDRLDGDLYIPETDDEAKEFVSEHQDVSVGFYNRVFSEYDGDTGDLTDDDVDGFQVDMYGNHIAGVERGRCSGSDGCGLDDVHGRAVLTKNVETHKATADGGTTSFLTKEDQTEEEKTSDVKRTMRKDHDLDYVIAPPSADYREDDMYYAIAPDENPDDEPKYPINNCSDVEDAWKLRGHGDYSIPQSDLESRIKRRAGELDCEVPGEMNDDGDSTMDDDKDFNIPDLSIDALAEKNDQVKEIVDERDRYQSAIEEVRDELGLEEDECPCDKVPEIKERADEAEDLEADLNAVKDALGLDADTDLTERVEDIAEEWTEMRDEKFEAKLDRLEELGAERERFENETMDALDEEIERREEVLEAADDISPTGIEQTEDGGTENTDRGNRRFGRGHAASPEDE